ncbi:MAG: hypothetical protein VX938_03105 [Myxococcota bacterium]|nr:hypothetical protein [Myxococcota bacterium]MEE2780072.1 hypothetical protein [Myxococcota bacterium]
MTSLRRIHKLLFQEPFSLARNFRLYNGNAAIGVIGPDIDPADDSGGLPSAPVGKRLASAGYTVMISGSDRVMAEMAQAVQEVGGEAVALRSAGPMNGVDLSSIGNLDVVEHPSSIRCIEALLEHADAVVLLPGDLSAMAILLQIWTFGHRADAPFRPILLLGERWPAMVKAVADAAGLDRRSRAMLSFANTAEEAVESLRYYVSPEPTNG